MTPEEKAAAEKAEAEAKAKSDAEEAKAKEDKTIAEVLDEDGQKPITVPEAAFLEEKKGRKEAEKELKEVKAKLEEALASGGTRAEIAADIDEIGKKHNVSGDFLRDLTNAITAKVRGESAKEVEEKIGPILAQGREAEKNTKFDEHFAKAMEAMPEFENIVNKEVIKSLVFNPQNKNKTFTQIIEDAYGNAIPGKRTIETTRPGGGKEPAEIDFARARTDSAYLKEILSDPTSKKKYNENIENRIGL